MRASTIALAIGLVAAAATVTLTVPSVPMQQAPFETVGELGDELQGRNIRAVVDDARFVETVAIEDWTGTWTGDTAGVWLVVDATASTVIEPSLLRPSLKIGDHTWTGSTRSNSTLSDSGLDPGLPMVGVILVELPADIASWPGADDARLVLQDRYDARVDSVLVYRIDLTGLGTAVFERPARPARTEW